MTQKKSSSWQGKRQYSASAKVNSGTAITFPGSEIEDCNDLHGFSLPVFTQDPEPMVYTAYNNEVTTEKGWLEQTADDTPGFAHVNVDLQPTIEQSNLDFANNDSRTLFMEHIFNSGSTGIPTSHTPSPFNAQNLDQAQSTFNDKSQLFKQFNAAARQMENCLRTLTDPCDRMIMKDALSQYPNLTDFFGTERLLHIAEGNSALQVSQYSQGQCLILYNPGDRRMMTDLKKYSYCSETRQRLLGEFLQSQYQSSI